VPGVRAVKAFEAAYGANFQPALSRLEAGGVVPTIPLPERISAALDAGLVVQLAPHAAVTASAITICGPARWAQAGEHPDLLPAWCPVSDRA
jgi:hypothetical protein